MQKKVLDLFAGAGGFSLGFEQSGFEIIGALEIDKWASETFKFNHPDSIVCTKDISQVSDNEIVDAFKGKIPDVIIGGPPCQGFSIANKLNGDTKDPRNSLFKDFVRCGKIFSPDFMIMENVPNITKAKTESGERVVDIIIQELEALGYFVNCSILNATDYGVPQIRRRFFVIASKHELLNPFPKPTHAIKNRDLFQMDLKVTPTLWDAISDLPTIEAREGSEEMEYTLNPQNSFQLELRNSSKRLCNHKAMKHSKRMVERFQSMSGGQSVSDVPHHLKPFKRNSNGKISEKVYDQNNRRMFADRPCHTIPASFYANFVHPYSHRNFTAREGARIQTFPDTFIFKGKPTVVSHKLLGREGREDEKFLCQYAQIGNAVPPTLARAIAENLLEEVK